MIGIFWEVIFQSIDSTYFSDSTVKKLLNIIQSNCKITISKKNNLSWGIFFEYQVSTLPTQPLGQLTLPTNSWSKILRAIVCNILESPYFQIWKWNRCILRLASRLFQQCIYMMSLKLNEFQSVCTNQCIFLKLGETIF